MPHDPTCHHVRVFHRTDPAFIENIILQGLLAKVSGCEEGTETFEPKKHPAVYASNAEEVIRDAEIQQNIELTEGVPNKVLKDVVIEFETCIEAGYIGDMYHECGPRYNRTARPLTAHDAKPIRIGESVDTVSRPPGYQVPELIFPGNITPDKIKGVHKFRDFLPGGPQHKRFVGNF